MSTMQGNLHQGRVSEGDWIKPVQIFNIKDAVGLVIKTLKSNGYYIERSQFINENRHCVLGCEELATKRKCVFYVLFKKDFFMSYDSFSPEQIAPKASETKIGESINESFFREYIEPSKLVKAIVFVYPRKEMYQIATKDFAKKCFKRTQHGGEVTLSVSVGDLVNFRDWLSQERKQKVELLRRFG